MEQSTNDFDILTFLLQRIIILLVSSGICARIKYGTVGFEFRIHDGKVTHSKPKIELDIRTEIPTK